MDHSEIAIISSIYDKHHLFTYGHEDQYYEAGAEHTVVEFMDFRILLLTCYDMRFPVWSRYASGLQYDAIICVANWPSCPPNQESTVSFLANLESIDRQRAKFKVLDDRDLL